MSLANLIVVGGPISVGKSTLVDALGLPQVQELDESDRLQALLLELLYKKERISTEIIELYFMQVRIRNYAKYSNTLQLHVLDRSLLESLWFARGTLSPRGYEHFAKLWEEEAKQLFAKYGKPKLYILLTCSWEVFKERMFMRGRDVEVKNFYDNEQYFHQHIVEYEKWMTDVFKKFDINYCKIETDSLSREEVLAEANRLLEAYHE